ncbi:MCE family protein [Gordonia hankookensis]|uniref:MCE family protein n=1 Tax=Gordonia hankookensis TaxID=589403 RepID=A0ABR7W7T3_9ACTN|nr:MCE family protein [Gordonia hankookensis]MBD1318571.1 MCE family protein [Gordonia hankookensis]
MPPLSRLARMQIAVVVVLGLVATAYAGFRYVHLEHAVGLGVYTVTASMKDSGGIFTNAEVTYQGVPVGRVGKLTLTKSGVDVALELNSGGPEIPASATAVVANRSAIGEQFVDLQPTSSAGPFLSDGSVITKSSVPPPLEDVVSSAIDFTSSIPVDDLHTVITELGKAFNGQGENLTRLVDSLSKLSRSGYDSLDQTISLIRNSNMVLETQADESDSILSWSHNLDLITATLASSDPDLRRLLTTGTASATQISELLRRSGGDISTVVKQLSSTLRTIGPTSYAIRPALAMLSQLSASSHATAPGDGQIHFGVVLETNNPAACTRGYEGTDAMIREMKRKDPSFDIHYDDFPFNTNAKCSVPVGNPTGVRGAARAALANPETTQPWDDTPKKDPDRLDLNPLAQQLAALMGVHPR